MTIRVLVTGFSVFPGAPYNPSETLVRLLEERGPDLGQGVVLETALLETSYNTIAGRLAEIGFRCPPDIALHFGLARTARGFRLERSARNAVTSLVPDITGYVPELNAICEGPDSHGSSLPLDAIHDALTTRGIMDADDTGGYVCNFTFYHSRGGLVAGFRPEFSGFIHIPYLDHQLAQMVGTEILPRLSEDMLWSGTLAIIEACVSSFAKNHQIDRRSESPRERNHRAVT